MIQSKSDAIRVPPQMTLYVRPTARKKPDRIIIYSGINDIQNKVNTPQKVRKVITTIKGIDANNEVQIAFSGVIHRDD